MPRPAEYDNLVRAGYFHDQPTTPGYLDQYLLVAAQCPDGASNTTHPTPVCADLQLSPGQQKLVTDAHSRRNETVYRAPLPPVSLAEAKAMIQILEVSLPLAREVTGARRRITFVHGPFGLFRAPRFLNIICADIPFRGAQT